MRKVLLYFGLMIICFSVVNAETNIYYVTNKGVEITEEQYNKFILMGYQVDEIANFDQKFFDEIKNFNIGDSNSIDVYYEDVYIYSSESSFKNKEKPISIISNKIDKKSYELGTKEVGEIRKSSIFSSSDALLYSLNNNYYETSYKKITLTITKDSSDSTKRRVSVALSWKIMPSVRSYDIIAMRVNQSTGQYFLDGTQSGTYNYTVSKALSCDDGTDTAYTNTYSNGNGGWNKKSILAGTSHYGVGLTHQLATDQIACYTDLQVPVIAPILKMSTNISSTAVTPNATLTVYATYQHATSTVSYSNVKSKYDFSASGLGNVISFTNNMAQYYDAMGGVSLSY